MTPIEASSSVSEAILYAWQALLLAIGVVYYLRLDRSVCDARHPFACVGLDLFVFKHSGSVRCLYLWVYRYFLGSSLSLHCLLV